MISDSVSLFNSTHVAGSFVLVVISLPLPFLNYSESCNVDAHAFILLDYF